MRFGISLINLYWRMNELKNILQPDGPNVIEKTTAGAGNSA